MLLKISRDIKKLNKDFDSFNEEELRSSLTEIENKINKALNSKTSKVIACGTSAVRVIETSVMASGMSKPGTGWTDKFIYPDYPWKITEAVITNFHRPESTLLMLAAAFGGYDFIMKAYEEAQEKDYRFFSFGDAMLIL